MANPYRIVGMRIRHEFQSPNLPLEAWTIMSVFARRSESHPDYWRVQDYGLVHTSLIQELNIQTPLPLRIVNMNIHPVINQQNSNINFTHSSANSIPKAKAVQPAQFVQPAMRVPERAQNANSGINAVQTNTPAHLMHIPKMHIPKATTIQQINVGAKNAPPRRVNTGNPGETNVTIIPIDHS
uniref:Uncharacterized protein n=1 Tax=viral metagenome TaxID=1070528 RepID=A0A6C0ECQ3_9ZZZZ